MRYLNHFQDYVGIYLVMDNGSSHIAAKTRTLLRGLKAAWVSICYAPPHASWLSQAELLLGAFSERYIKRGSWGSCQAKINHLDASWLKYNEIFAHPCQWSRTRLDFHQWMKKEKGGISCNT